MTGTVSITGEISLLWRDADAYHGDVILLTLDPDDPGVHDTFELKGPLAARFPDGALDEGDRVRIDCRTDVVEVVNQETGETHDERVPVVVDVHVLR